MTIFDQKKKFHPRPKEGANQREDRLEWAGKRNFFTKKDARMPLRGAALKVIWRNQGRRSPRHDHFGTGCCGNPPSAGFAIITAKVLLACPAAAGRDLHPEGAGLAREEQIPQDQV
jgi:hypothetical protein